MYLILKLWILCSLQSKFKDLSKKYKLRENFNKCSWYYLFFQKKELTKEVNSLYLWYFQIIMEQIHFKSIESYQKPNLKKLELYFKTFFTEDPFNYLKHHHSTRRMLFLNIGCRSWDNWETLFLLRNNWEILEKNIFNRSGLDKIFKSIEGNF